MFSKINNSKIVKFSKILASSTFTRQKKKVTANPFMYTTANVTLKNEDKNYFV